MGMITLLAACGGAPAGLSDPRAARLLAMPEPQFVANRVVSLDLSNECQGYDWNVALDIALNVNRARDSGGNALSPVALGDAAELEEDLLRQSLRAQYGGANACTVLDGERDRRSPLSVMVEKV